MLVEGLSSRMHERLDEVVFCEWMDIGFLGQQCLQLVVKDSIHPACGDDAASQLQELFLVQEPAGTGPGLHESLLCWCGLTDSSNGLIILYSIHEHTQAALTLGHVDRRNRVMQQLL